MPGLTYFLQQMEFKEKKKGFYTRSVELKGKNSNDLSEKRKMLSKDDGKYIGFRGKQIDH